MKRNWLTWFNIAAALTALVLAVSLYRAKADAQKARERVAVLEAEVARLETETKVLAAEAALLESPARIDRLARSQLGAAPPEPAELAP